MAEPGPPAVGGKTARGIPAPLRSLLVLGLLFLFLVGVKLLETGIKGLGSDAHERLFEGVSNPLAGLFVGVLATVLVQSSSVTTATIVGLVASGVLSVQAAVPMVMGANIGTTVTNTLVSLGHVRHSTEFRRAFAAATMHDFFNVLAVLVLLPVEITTHALSRAASWITHALVGGRELGGSFNSPIKGAITWMAGFVEDAAGALTRSDTLAAVLIIVAGITLVFATLALITKNMRVLVAARIERSLNAALARSGLVGMLVGMVVTIAVQSSSITTSILIPLVASGILAIQNAYPITLGANVGTTITALLAALGTGAVDGLTIAVTHTLFNVAGILIFYPAPRLRHLPIRLAEGLAELAIRHRFVAFTYLIIAFFVVPGVGIVILR